MLPVTERGGVVALGGGAPFSLTSTSYNEASDDGGSERWPLPQRGKPWACGFGSPNIGLISEGKGSSRGRWRALVSMARTGGRSVTNPNWGGSGGNEEMCKFNRPDIGRIHRT